MKTEKAFSINVLDINEEPDTILITPNSLPENDDQATVTIEIIDQDYESNYTITKSAGDGDDDNDFFLLVENNCKLKPIEALNFEEKNSYKVRVKVDDGVHFAYGIFEITVSDLNDRPDSLTLSGDVVMDGMGSGYAIGSIDIYDQDAEDEHELDLIKGGDIFYLSKNDSLVTKIPLTYNYADPDANEIEIIVRATDSAGLSRENSFIIHVLPFVDSEQPEFFNFVKGPDFINENVNSINTSIVVQDNESIKSIALYYRPIRSNATFQQYDNLNIEIISSKRSDVFVQFPASVMDEMGIEYYFKSIDEAGNSDSTDLVYTYQAYKDIRFDPTQLSYKGNIESYRIIANPYDIESNRVSAIFSDYDISNIETWRLFNFQNGQPKEIGTSTSESMVQGNGYWFNKSESLSKAITFDTARVHQNNKSNLFKIELKKGWNLIGNPYPFLLDWGFVLEENDLNESYSLQTYKDGKYTESNSIDIFEGGFVFAEQNTTLSVPISDPNKSGRRIASKGAEYDLLVNFKLDNGILQNQLGGLGMHNKANVSFDQYDRPLLPRFGVYADLAFSHPEHFSKSFAKDIVPTAENHIWEFEAIANQKDKFFTLSWYDLNNKYIDKELILYDINNEVIINMQKVSEYDLTLHQPIAFKVIYGDKQFIDETLSTIQIAILNPFPNPFQETINIPISLPHSVSEYQIELELHNIMGERIFSLKENEIKRKSYLIQLNDYQQSNFKQGIYIYSIKVKNRFLTKEFHGRIVKNE